MTSIIDLNHVRIFTKVVEAGGFSAAARRLGQQKAGVSRAVGHLEAALNARLLERTTRKLKLTPIGEAFYAKAVTAITDLEIARELVEAAHAEPSGTIRVSAPVYLGSRSLIDWIAEFMAMYPAVDFQLHLTDDHVDLVAGGIDVALRTGKLPDSSLIAHTIGPIERVFVAAPAYLQRRGTPASIEDLGMHDWVLLGKSGQASTIVMEAPSGDAQVDIRARLSVDTAEGALRAALGGVGIALLPLGVAARSLADGRLLPVLPMLKQRLGGFHVVFPSQRHMRAAQRLFIDHVVARGKILLSQSEDIHRATSMDHPGD